MKAPIGTPARWPYAGGRAGIECMRCGRSQAGYHLPVGIVLYIILLFIIGLFVGALARLLLPGPDPMSIPMTALVGVCGTFSAGLFSWYVLHRHGGGLILSVIFSMLVVWIYRRTHLARYGGRGAMGRGPYRRGGPL